MIAVVQEHHISYKPHVAVFLYKGEHWIITQMDRWKRKPSVGFVKALEVWLALNKPRAVEVKKRK